MSKLYDFGFFNIQFDTKAVDEDGNHRKTNFNNLHFNIKGKSLFASAENGSGKTSIFRLLKSQFVPINKAASDNASASLNNYFKYTQGAYPAIIWSDFISNKDSNMHTMIITYNQLKSDINLNQLEKFKPSEALDRYGLVINYNAKKNPASTENDFGIIPKLGLISKDNSGAYLPCAIEDIKENIDNNAKSLKYFDPKIDIIFSRSLNYSKSINDFHEAMLKYAYAPNDVNLWKTVYSQILNSEGGIINIFFNTKYDNSLEIKKARTIISDLLFPAIIAQSDNEENFEIMKKAIHDLFKSRMEHSKKFRELQRFQRIQRKIKQIDTEAYKNRLKQFMMDKNQEYQAKAKLIYTNDLLKSEIDSYQSQISQCKSKLLQAEYATYLLTKKTAQAAYEQIQSEIIKTAQAALQYRDARYTLEKESIKRELNDANAALANAKKEKQEFESQTKRSDNQRNIEILSAELKKYYSDKKAILTSKLKEQEEKEKERQEKYNKLSSYKEKQEKERTQLSRRQGGLQNEVNNLEEHTQGYTEQQLELQKNNAQNNIKKFTQTVSEIKQVISNNNLEIEKISEEINKNSESKTELVKKQGIKGGELKNITEKRKQVLQILREYHDILKLSDNATKDEIVNRFDLKLNKLETSRKTYLSKELSLSKQIDNLKNKSIIDIPESVQKFIQVNDIKAITGFEYLSTLELAKAKEYITKYSYLPFALLVDSEDFNKFQQFQGTTGIESLLVVNKEKLDTFKSNNTIIIGNLDLDYIANYDGKVKELSNKLEQIETEGNQLKKEFNNLTEVKAEIISKYVSETDVTKVQTAVSKIEEKVNKISLELKKLEDRKKQLIFDNRDISNQIEEIEKELKEAQASLTKIETLLPKFQDLATKKQKLIIVEQDLKHIDNEIKQVSKEIVEINKFVSALQIAESETKRQLENIEDKVTTYRDADATLINESDLINFSAKAAEKELNRLREKQSSDLKIIELRIEHNNETIKNLEKNDNNLDKDYLVDIKPYKKYLVQNESSYSKGQNNDFWDIEFLKNKFSSLNEAFIRQEENSRNQNESLQKANQELHEFGDKHPEIDNSFNLDSLYHSISEAEENVQKYKDQIASLDQEHQRLKNLQKDVASTIKFKVNSDPKKLVGLKREYSSQNKFLNDNDEAVKSLINKVESLSNDELKTEICQAIIEEWKKLKLENEDFSDLPSITIKEIQSDLNHDLKNLSIPNIVAKGQMIHSIFLKAIKLLKNGVEAQIETLEKGNSILKVSQKTIANITRSIAHALQDGIIEISKNSSVKLDRFSKAHRLVQIVMPNDVPDLDNPEILDKKYDEINGKIDYLYDEFEKIINQENLNLTDHKKANKVDKKLYQFINENIKYTTLYSWSYGNTLDHINFKVFNPYSLNKVQYLKWEGDSSETIGSSSGAQRLTFSLCMLIPILRYLSADRNYSDILDANGQMELFGKSKGIYLPVDNFTANATKEELLAGVLEFAEKADIQIVSLNQISSTNISDDFHDTISLSNDSDSRIALINLKLIPAQDNNMDFLSMNFVDKKVD